MPTSIQQNDKINKICSLLPSWASAFFYEIGTQRAVSTRLAYAREISIFFDYIRKTLPYLAKTPKSKITIEQIARITSQDITSYIDSYQKKGNQERALARKRAALSSFFRYLSTNGKILFNPVVDSVRVKIPESEVFHLNLDEQHALLHAVETGEKLTLEQQKRHKLYRLRDLAIITLLLDTGMRVSEIHAMDIIDVDFEDCYVVVIRNAINVEKVQFSEATRDVLQDYLDERRKWDDQADGKFPLFTTTRGRRFAIRSIQDMVKKYAESAFPGKGQKISPNSLRASFAMEFYGEEKDTEELKRKLGQRTNKKEKDKNPGSK